MYVRRRKAFHCSGECGWLRETLIYIIYIYIYIIYIHIYNIYTYIYNYIHIYIYTYIYIYNYGIWLYGSIAKSQHWGMFIH